jgi:antitoxin (DNA-binding transcriptional repressor) of toxin-antitoxin stability system
MWSHAPMTTVGIRELKARLSSYVRRVRRGEVVRVTDRGEVVAELRQPAPQEDVPPELAGLAELAKRGLVRLGKSNKGVKYRASPVRLPDGTAKATLDADREDRV